ncbi:MAG: hypothetical protein Q8R04_00430, partial [Nanoarchaeota archaeon]|nr:hypothetical protein [Nanoarchaeota archaeon]
MTSVEEIANNNGINASRYWIKQFKILPPHQIGVVKASGKLLTGQPLEQLAKEMSYMANVGRHENNEAQFYLPLVIGGGVH